MIELRSHDLPDSDQSTGDVDWSDPLGIFMVDESEQSVATPIDSNINTKESNTLQKRQGLNKVIENL